MNFHSQRILPPVVSGLAALTTGLAAGFWLAGFWAQPVPEPEEQLSDKAPSTETTEEQETTAAPADDVPAIDKAVLADIVADFEIPADARFSLIIHDLTNQERLVSHNSADLYPTASLYKLYVAYITYEEIDAGRLALEQPFIRHPLYLDLTLGTCLNLMIEVSDSACAEQLLGDYGYPAIQAALDRLELPHANAAAFQISTEDMTRLLELIYSHNLSADSRNRLLGSMHKQAYEIALQPVFRPRGQVYNKTGTYRNPADPNDPYNWIEGGIVELADRPQALAISIFHENVAAGRSGGPG